ncbi:MAG: hypothetical protein V7K92_06255 [Nostoc sp.]
MDSSSEPLNLSSGRDVDQCNTLTVTKMWLMANAPSQIFGLPKESDR